MKKIIIFIVAIVCIGVGFTLLITKTVKFPSKNTNTTLPEGITTVAADASAVTDESDKSEQDESDTSTKSGETTQKGETTKKERTTRPRTTRSPGATTRKMDIQYAQDPDEAVTTTAGDSGEDDIPTMPAVSAKDHPYTFATDEDFDRNFAQHGSEFGDITPDQYLTYANSLILSTTKYVQKKYVGGVTHFYNPPTGEYASVSAEGNIITYYRPKEPDKFWANIGA